MYRMRDGLMRYLLLMLLATVLVYCGCSNGSSSSDGGTDTDTGPVECDLGEYIGDYEIHTPSDVATLAGYTSISGYSSRTIVGLGKGTATRAKGTHTLNGPKAGRKVEICKWTDCLQGIHSAAQCPSTSTHIQVLTYQRAALTKRAETLSAFLTGEGV